MGHTRKLRRSNTPVMLSRANRVQKMKNQAAVSQPVILNARQKLLLRHPNAGKKPFVIGTGKPPTGPEHKETKWWQFPGSVTGKSRKLRNSRRRNKY